MVSVYSRPYNFIKLMSVGNQISVYIARIGYIWSYDKIVIIFNK